ncbi:MAG: hypothetical protein KF797_00780 [Flavobacteriales bacterium]|nr:hypothetical protein [Flavobacteriales bacterium]
MIKKFALLATMAAFFVACGSSTQENMENKAEEAGNAGQELLDKVEAETEAIGNEAVATGEAVVDTIVATGTEAVDAAKEAVGH